MAFIKYTHVFDTQQEHDAEYNGTGYLEPWVAVTKSSGVVTYNKQGYRFDDIVMDVSKYSAGTVSVIMGEGRNAGNVRICLTDEAQTIQDIVSSCGLVYNASVEAHDIPVPSEGDFLYITTTLLENDSDFTADGNLYTVAPNGAQTEYTNSKIWYVYDMGAMVRYRTEVLSSSSGSIFKQSGSFPTVFEYSDIVQRENVNKKITKITIDTLQHVTQLSDKSFAVSPGIRCSVSAVRLGQVFTEYTVYGNVVRDFFSDVSVDSDEDGNVQTAYLTTSPLFTNVIYIMLGDVFEGKSGTWTYKLVVDDEEEWSTTITVGSGDTWQSSSATYDEQNGGWSGEILVEHHTI